MARRTDDMGSDTSAAPTRNAALSRRKLLLAGTSLVAVTVINAADSTQLAQAQQPLMWKRSKMDGLRMVNLRW